MNTTLTREVSKDEFYAAMGPLNVTPVPTGPYPYTSLFKTPDGVTHGKAVGYYPEGSALPASRYFLPEST